jgi:hypothetical protein
VILRSAPMSCFYEVDLLSRRPKVLPKARRVVTMNSAAYLTLTCHPPVGALGAYGWSVLSGAGLSPPLDSVEPHAHPELRQMAIPKAPAVEHDRCER